MNCMPKIFAKLIIFVDMQLEKGQTWQKLEDFLIYLGEESTLFLQTSGGRHVKGIPSSIERG